MGVAAAIAIVSLAMWTVEGQTPSVAKALASTAKAGPVPKTSWGDPDLQGIWTDILTWRPVRSGAALSIVPTVQRTAR